MTTTTNVALREATGPRFGLVHLLKLRKEPVKHATFLREKYGEVYTMRAFGIDMHVVSGPDAFEFTNLLVARDLNKCAVEQCKYVFLCLPDGGIINDPVLLRVEENRFWLSLADSDVELWARGVAYKSGHDVTIKEIDVGPVQVQGPKSKDVMVDLFGDSILEIPYYYLRPYELEGMKVLVSRTGYTGEDGFEIYADKDEAVRLWNDLMEYGARFGIQPAGLAARRAATTRWSSARW